MSQGSSPGCLAIHLLRADGRELGSINGSHSTRVSSTKGLRLFQDFQAENSLLAPWNPALAESVAGLEFVALLRPGTLLVAGSPLHLECVRGAAARNVLRPPSGHKIKSIGDVGEREESSSSGTRFYPLAEALCSLIGGLNAVGHPATAQSLYLALQRRFHQTATPPLDAVEKTLGWLLSEGRLYCMGSHYFLSTPDMYAQFQAQKALIANPNWTTSLQRPDKGCSREIETQTGESIVMGIPAYKPKRDAASTAKPPVTTALTTTATQFTAPAPKDKHGGFFRRLFRRSKSRETLHRKEEVKEEPKAESRASSLSAGPVEPTPIPISTFTAQFPPTEWLHDPNTFRVPKSRRVRDKKDRDRVGGSVWIDLEPGSVLPPPPRRRANDPRVVSGRFPTCPEHLANHAGRHSPKPERRSHRHRLHKFLSSSSEALHPITPRAHEERRKHRRSQHQPLPRPESPRAPLAAPTATDLDSTIDHAPIQNKSKSPAKESHTHTHQETTINRVSDSALSTSPVVTEMSSSSSAKFSSWSGSEGRRPDPSYVNLPHDRIQEETSRCSDGLPSPILARRGPRCARLDPTYENLEAAGGLESTHFEDLSLEDAAEEPILAADSSLQTRANYISAL